jgi:hypothetical protein
MIKIRELPIRVTIDGQQVDGLYIAERKAITLATLPAFLTRWRPIYDLGPPSSDADERVTKSYKSMQELLAGNYKPEEIMACFAKLDANETCDHVKQFSCCAMHIFLPMMLIESFMVSIRYGVTFNHAMVQLNGGIEAYPEIVGASDEEE